MTFEEAKKKLSLYNQEHILKYYEDLNDEEKKLLLAQIDETDFSVIEAYIKKNTLNPKGVISPLNALEIPDIEIRQKHFTELGIEAIRNGIIGAVLLAGGMGTRLGSDNPKGMFNIGVTKVVYIFECLINNLMQVVNECGTYIHLFVMTSEKNHELTVNFFREQNYFGYDRDYIHFFRQEMAPAIDYNGKILMESKGRIATSPNGNGGWFSSLMRSELYSLLQKNRIEYLNVFAVDNVLQKIADPAFIGATIDNNCAVGAKVVRKSFPDEKVGVMCLENNHPSIIEYYELTDEMRNTLNEKGEPAYNFGVILNYLFRVEDLVKISNGKLPLHIVEKQINHIDDNGSIVKPSAPNGYKFEQLILDMIRELDGCLPYEVVREKEFAPIKNAIGADSVESARILLKKNNIEL